MRIVTVLRCGGEYRPEHVTRLRHQVATWNPEAEFVCLTDVSPPGWNIPLRHDWPGWWSKMEVFRPDIEGDLLFMDLDTSVVGSLTDIASVGRLTILRDFYRQKGLGSGLMFLPERERGLIWREWTKRPQGWMRIHKRGGDQAFLERFWLGNAARWQDIVPGQVVSYKADSIALHGLPDGARVVCFHGKPRPWAVGW